MELLNELLELPCVCGFEQPGNKKLLSYLDLICDKSGTDALGNVYGIISAVEKDAPTVLLCAHYDIIGLIVTDICDNGFVKFSGLGGIDERILPGQEVIIHGKEDVFGVIGLRPPHILSADEMKSTEKTDKLSIDTAYSKEKLESLIKIGTPVSFKNSLVEMGENICSRGLDNRAGCWAVLRAGEALSKEKLNTNVILLFTSSEELGRTGAKAAASRFSADVAVIVDATFGKSPDCPPYSSNPLGNGPVLCKGPVLNRYYVNQIEAVAKNKNIPYSVEVESGDPGTDAFVLETYSGGTPCVMVSYPLRYMHTTAEIINSRDLENTSLLLQEFVLGFEEVEYA